MTSRFLLVLTLFILFRTVNAAESQGAVPPQLPQVARTPDGFVLHGWKMEQITRGDLNGDGEADIAFVLRQDAPEKIKKNNSGPGVPVYNTNPRILAVALFERARNRYRLIVENPGILPGQLEPTIDDPFDRIKIQRGQLRVETHFWANAGSYLSSTTRLFFSHTRACVRLTLFEQKTLDRRTGDRHDLTLNLLSGSSIVETWNEAKRSVPRQKQRTAVTPPKAICIETMIDPLESLADLEDCRSPTWIN